MNNAQIIFFLLLFLINGLNQEILAQESPMATFYMNKAKELPIEKTDSSVYFILKAMEIFQSNGNTKRYLESQQYLIVYYLNLQKYDQADSLTESNWEMVQNELSPKNPSHFEIYGYSAANQASLQFFYENYIDGIKLFELAFEILERVDSIKQSELAFLYLEAGPGFRKIGDYSQALRYYKKALSIFLSYEDEVSSKFPSLYFNIGRVYSERNKIDSALLYFQKSQKSLIQPDLDEYTKNATEISINSRKSTLYEKIGDLDSSYIYAQKAIRLLNNSTDSITQSLTYAAAGLAATSTNRFEEANDYFIKSQRYNRYYSPIYSPEIDYYINFNLGKLRAAQGLFQEAEMKFDLALQLCTFNNSQVDSRQVDFANKHRVLHILLEKFRRLKYDQNPSKTDKSIEDLSTAIKLIKEIRHSFNADESKFDLSKLAHQIFEEGIRLSHKQSTDHKELSSHLAAFTYIESSKSILLYEALLDQEAQLGLPPEMRKKERSYKRDLAYYEKTLFDHHKKSNKSSNKISELQDSVFALQQRYKRFQDTLESDYPSYYQQKYNLELASLEEVENQLKVNEAFLQYFVGDSSIFVMGIHPEKQVFQRMPFTDSLLSPIQAYLEFLSSPNELSSKERGDTYVQNAHMLYKTLLAPVLSQLPKEIDRLIISPDGILSYIPFEALLEEGPQEEWRYSDLPYLIHSHAISYTHSATHWLEQQEPSEQMPPHNWLGFAPSYEEVQITASVQPLALNRFLTRDGSIQLPHAQEEISRISQMIGGQGFFQTSALESDFHREADQYQVLHLATHGLVEDQQPLYSKLVFAPEDDSVYDGFLHAYEIYNMQLPANLVVLSACNTGVGKLEKGEGIMSLSRAFFYAGVKSLLMSLWKVSDESTSELMVSFYEGLKAGEDKDLALQQAKVTYIQNQEIAMKSHPYFWAGFVLKGDAGALSLKSSWGYWIYFLLGFLVLLGLVFGVRSSRKKLGD